MSVYDKLVELARDATIGMTDKEVLDATGLSFATWRKWIGGQGVSDRSILQFCARLGLSAEPFIEELQKASGRYMSHDKIMMTALELSNLSQEAKRELMAEYRRIASEDKDRSKAGSAA